MLEEAELLQQPEELLLFEAIPIEAL